MISKIRREEVGITYAVRRLRDFGAPARQPGDSWGDWTARVLRQPPFRRIKHPGNYAYVFGLNAGTRARLEEIHGGGQPYPGGAMNYAGP